MQPGTPRQLASQDAQLFLGPHNRAPLISGNYIFFGTEGEQNMPLPHTHKNMPFWHKGYLELVIFKKKQTENVLQT